MSEITDELLRRLERATTAPLELTKDSSSPDELYEGDVGCRGGPVPALRDAIVRLDARLDAAGVPMPPDDDQ